MVFDIEVAGRMRRVAIQPVSGTSNRFQVAIDDGVPRLVDCWRPDASTLSLILPEDGHASHEIAVTTEGDGRLVLRLNGVKVPVGLNGRRARSAVPGSAPSTGMQCVAAPMPGKVLRVLVGVGQDVAAGQPLVVVEAMKMENELRSPRAGRVAEVLVGEGTSVEAGRPLVTVE